MSGLPCDDCSNNAVLTNADVIPLEVDEIRVPFASLYTYADDKDETNFAKIYLPPICVNNGMDLFNMFYINKTKSFSPFVLNTIVAGLNKKGLRDAFLNAYEESTGKSKFSLTSQQSILLMSELDNSKINKRVQKIVHLNANDFEESIMINADVHYDEVEHADEVAAVLADWGYANGQDGPNIIITPAVEYAAEVKASYRVRTSVDIHIYSETLQMGFILYVQFIAKFFDDDIVTLPVAQNLPSYDGLIVSDVDHQACGLCISYPAV